MKKKNYWIRFSVLLVLIRFFSMVPVSAKWIINPSLGQDDTLNIGGITNDASKRVAYIEGDTDELGFTTIEAALAKATQKGGSQKVVVTANTTIKNDCVISKGVELRIPYSQSKIAFDNPNKKVHKEKDSTVSDSPKLKLNVDLGTNNKAVTLTIAAGGYLSILGDYYGGAAVSTQGAYAQRTRKKNSKLIVDGTLRCFGFIKNDSNYLEDNGSLVDVTASGYVWEPLVVYDWPSGTTATSRYLNGVFPFQQFDLPNISAPIKISSGGTLAAQIQIYLKKLGRERSINTTVNAIGYSNSLINLTSGSITWNYGINQKSQDFVANRSNHLTKIITNGSASLGSVLLKFMGIDVDSSKCSIPMGPQFSVDVQSGSFVVGNRSHWFGGNEIRIEKDAFVTLTADTAVFDDSVSGIKGSRIINNGSLGISAAFGGNVLCETQGSILALGNSNSITADFLISGTKTKKTFQAIGYQSKDSTTRTNLDKSSIYESGLRTNQVKSGYWGQNNNLYVLRYKLSNYVTSSDTFLKKISAQKIDLSKEPNANVVIAAPQQSTVNSFDDDLVRSCSSVKITGEGEDKTYEVVNHTGYAKFQGWYTKEEGQGNSISQTTWKITDLSAKCDNNHLIRLYDYWTSDLKISIQFIKPNPADYCGNDPGKSACTDTNKEYAFDESSGSRKDTNVSFLTKYTRPECGFSLKEKKWTYGRHYVFPLFQTEWYTTDGTDHNFSNWEEQVTGQSFLANQVVSFDESLLTPDSQSLSLKLDAVFDRKKS